MKKGIDFAHDHGKKVYVTANITAHNNDLKGVREYFKELKHIGPDALIISDPGVFMIAREECPEIDIHVSTQSNNVNYDTFMFWQKLGATRVVTARELSIKEIKEIREHIPDDLEIETFVFYWKRCKSWCLHTPMQMEILCCGGTAPRGVSSS